MFLILECIKIYELRFKIRSKEKVKLELYRCFLLLIKINRFIVKKDVIVIKIKIVNQGLIFIIRKKFFNILNKKKLKFIKNIKRSERQGEEFI